MKTEEKVELEKLLEVGYWSTDLSDKDRDRLVELNYKLNESISF